MVSLLPFKTIAIPIDARSGKPGILKRAKKMLVTKRATREKANGIQDWDSFLRSYWLVKMAASTFYDDAKILHGNNCRCCTRSRILTEVKKRK